MKYLSYFLIIYFLVSACKSDPKLEIFEQYPDKVHRLDAGKEDQLSLFDIFSSVEVIPLETSRKSIVNFPVFKFEVHKNNYYVLDEKQESVFLFDSEGNFVQKINKAGRGPGEYSLLKDFNINRFSGDLEFLSAMGYIQVYDISGEKYKKTVRLPSEIRAVHAYNHLDSDVYVFFSMTRKEKEEKLLFYSEKDKKIVAEKYPFPHQLLMFMAPMHTPFYVYNNELYFTETFSGFLFGIDKNSYDLIPRYLWDFGKNNLDRSLLWPIRDSRNYYQNTMTRIYETYPIGFNLFAENGRYIFQNYFFKGSSRNLIVDKQHNEYYTIAKFKEGVILKPDLISGNAVYSCVSPEQLEYFLNENILDKNNRRKLESIKLESNPVIVKYNFK